MRPKITAGWLFDCKTDLAFFAFPILLGIVAVASTHLRSVTQSSILMLVYVNGFGIGHIHTGLSWLHYLDKRNLAQFKLPENWKQAYLFPLLLIPSMIFMYAFSPNLVTALSVVWGLQHMMQQNMGIAILYQNHGRDEVVLDRDTVARPLQGATLVYALMFLHGFIHRGPLLSQAFLVAAAVAGCLTLALVGKYVFALSRQVAQGRTLNAAAVSFWFIALLSFSPLLVNDKRFYAATFVGSMLHWFQYIGLNYILVKRKYSQPDQSEHLIARIGPIGLCLLTGGTMLIVLASLTIVISKMHPSWSLNCLMGFMVSLGLMHYVQDAFIWRFRIAFNRQAILPYLKPILSTVPHTVARMEPTLVS